MNRARLNAPLVLLAPFVLLAALLYPVSSRAQYMYLDTNGDGVHTDADVLSPTGLTHVAVWLDTHHDRNGSLQSCNSHTDAPHSWERSTPDPGLDIFSYDIFLTATHGTIVWGGFEDRIGFEKLPNGDDVATDTQIHITRFADVGHEKPAGLYKLGTMTVSVGAGTPSIFFGLMVGWDFTCFGTHCSASDEFPNSYVYGTDWFDADGIQYGGTINHEPTLVQPNPIRVIENRTADQFVTANDDDGQSLSFTKVSGPDYVTVSTAEPGSGQGLGLIRVVPASADVGMANVVVRASDGIFWCDRTISVVVRREFELNAQPDVNVVAGEVAYNPLYADNPLDQALQFSMVSGPSFVSIDSPIYGIRTRISPTAQDIGTWTVTLAVTNGTARDEKSFTVVVVRKGDNRAPVAIAGGPIVGVVGHTVRLDGSRSSDPDGDALSYQWSFGDGSPGLTGPLVEHRYAAEGDYMVDLMVRDPDLFAVGSTTAHIVTTAPARAYLAGGPAAIMAGPERDVSVRIEPQEGTFECVDLDAARIWLDSPAPAASGATEPTRSIAATGFDKATETDGDRNGFADRGVVFSGRDFAILLDAIPGRQNQKMKLTIRGELAGGGRFSAPVEVTVVRRGGSLSAGVSPNPMNPLGQLSFVTSRPGRADVRVFDVSGRLAQHAIDHVVLPAGYHEVLVGHGDGGHDLPSGVYFYRIETTEGVARGRFSIVR
jgi:PKD repeat protein